MATFTLYLVVISAFQLAAGVFTYLVAKKTASVAHDNAKIALAQKRIGDRQLEQMEAQNTIAQMNAEAAAKSANTAEQQLRLAHEQWLDLLDWEATYESHDDGPATVGAACRVVNNTSHKVVLTRIVVNTSTGGSLDETLSLTLPPKRGYPLIAPDWEVNTPERMGEYRNGRVRFRVYGEIEFIDALGTRQCQLFAQLIAGGIQGGPPAFNGGTPEWKFYELDWTSNRTDRQHAEKHKEGQPRDQ